MKKSIWPKVWLIIGCILMVCFVVGLIYLHNDYPRVIQSYGSTPLSVYYAIHAVFFLLPSLICLTVSFVLHSGYRNK
ncbi:hypothetical protein SAMN04488542_103234 [Fontibacillus panacisegetis]|uniref:Uncharacterized protein n=1 Tax=Fontibacillus panacisegetis TaxID=670482 RepID=A0A1G7GWT8_9BACL|nr:hypothetical protein SAMN04488542_103234 [Fontibacillus panacisegetis]